MATRTRKEPPPYVGMPPWLIRPCLCLGCTLCLGVHLHVSPVNFAPNYFLRPGGARAPSAPPRLSATALLLLARTIANRVVTLSMDNSPGHPGVWPTHRMHAVYQHVTLRPPVIYAYQHVACDHPISGGN